MSAIIKRELSSYFNSAIGYIVLAVFYFFSGLFFYMYCLLSNTTSMSYVFLSMLMVVMLVIPIITMKSFSEERKQKTDQALLTAPISLTEMVLGKFFGAFLLYCICNAIYVLYAVILSFYATPDWAVFLTTMLGMLLMGGALIAIYLFISALTGQRAQNVLPEVNSVWAQASRRVGTGALNDVLGDAQIALQPPMMGGRKLKIYYGTQTGTCPPSFALFVNSEELMHFSYQRYLENCLRKAFGFEGTPIRFLLRERVSD